MYVLNVSIITLSRMKNLGWIFRFEGDLTGSAQLSQGASEIQTHAKLYCTINIGIGLVTYTTLTIVFLF